MDVTAFGEARGAPGGHPLTHAPSTKRFVAMPEDTRTSEPRPTDGLAGPPAGGLACAPAGGPPSEAEGKTGPSFECAVCLERTALRDSFRIACGHQFCRSCVKGQAEEAAAAGEREVHCPADGCARVLRIWEIMAAAGAAVMVRIERRAEAHAVETNPALHYCPTPDCGHVARWDVRLQPECAARLDCPRCHKTACLQCKASPYHEGLNCDAAAAAAEAQHGATEAKSGAELPAGGADDEAMLKAALEEGNFRVCKRCGNGVEKSAGCFKMKCRCGFRFCFKCGIENAQCDCTPRHHGFIDNRTGYGDFEHLHDEKSPDADVATGT